MLFSFLSANLVVNQSAQNYNQMEGLLAVDVASFSCVGEEQVAVGASPVISASCCAHPVWSLPPIEVKLCNVQVWL